MRYFGGAFAARFVQARKSRVQTSTIETIAKLIAKGKGKREEKEACSSGTRENAHHAGLNYRRGSSLFHCQLNLMIAAGYCVFIVRPARGRTVYAVNDALIPHTFTYDFARASRGVFSFFLSWKYSDCQSKTKHPEEIKSNIRSILSTIFFRRSSAFLSKRRDVFFFVQSVKFFAIEGSLPILSLYLTHKVLKALA